MTPPTQHLAKHLRWWDWAVIAVNLAAVASCLAGGAWAAAFTSFVIGALYASTIWFLRDALIWRDRSNTLLDILTAPERQQP